MKLKLYIYALMAGLFFAICAPAFAKHGGPHAPLETPLLNHRTAVMSAARDAGQLQNPAFVSAISMLDAVTAKYEGFDLGIQADCQGGAIGADRAIAFAAINRAVDALGSNASVGYFAPLMSISHAQVMFTLQHGWPALQSLSPQDLAAANLADRVEALTKLQDSLGDMPLTPDSPQHWGITHPFAMQAAELVGHWEVHQQHRLQEQVKYSAIFSLLLAAVFAIPLLLAAHNVSKPRKRLGHPVVFAE